VYSISGFFVLMEDFGIDNLSVFPELPLTDLRISPGQRFRIRQILPADHLGKNPILDLLVLTRSVAPNSGKILSKNLGLPGKRAGGRQANVVLLWQ
jgi:hypothetical protein